jgi:XTP/dITP diphosphohydrolase/tetrapyrrole methylase family protein/MazG family protein/ATP diphosphatase
LPGGEALAAAILDLQALTERLRRECPWDRSQTASTIVPHTVEEAYEVADAVALGDDRKLADELGDLLFQSFFLALLLEEREAGDLATVARGVHAKLVRRHPHVFGDAALTSAGAVREQWETIKAAEEGRAGVFHDVPENLPGLMRAKKVQRRAASVGFEHPGARSALASLDEEVTELRVAVTADHPAEGEPSERHVEEVGDVLFAVVAVARGLNVDPELALRSATDRFVERLEAARALAAADGHDFAALELDGQERYFQHAKHGEVRQT